MFEGIVRLSVPYDRTSSRGTADRVPDSKCDEAGRGDGVLREAGRGRKGPECDDSGLGGMALKPGRTTRRCSAGERCVSHATLGEPAKLSRGNPGPMCFACGERRAASALGETAAKAKPAVGPGDDRRPLAQCDGRRGGGRKACDACSEGRCERPAVEGRRGARICRKHAEARRAREWREGRTEWHLTCERNLRDALAMGDEALARKWSELLEEAEAALAWAEADLAAAEARACSEPSITYETPRRAGATLWL